MDVSSGSVGHLGHSHGGNASNISMNFNSSGVGMNGPNEGDANAALAELDQGLRCGRLGEQSEAIVKFPRLFAKYPFPILINSALLKLADIFRQSSNFIKLCVLRVVQQSERHLDKITNVDEFVKRVSTVLHSNDPVARALTLRMLGSMASIIPERKSAHYSVQNAIEQPQDAYNAEFQAAVYAAGRFSQKSESFTIGICPKILLMVRNHSTPLNVKLELLTVFQHMNKIDSSTASLVRQTLINMIPLYPAKEFVIVALQTLTLLSTHTLTDVPSQVELLLKHLLTDIRSNIKQYVLKNLLILAGEDKGYLWSGDNIRDLISFSEYCCKSDDDNILCKSLSILCLLVKHTNSAEHYEICDSNSPILQLCRNCCYRNSFFVVAKGCHLITLITVKLSERLYQLKDHGIVSQAVSSIEALLFLMSANDQKIDLSQIKENMQSAIRLCEGQPEASDQLIGTIGSCLKELNDTQRDQTTMLLLIETLASLGHIKIGVIEELLPDVCGIIESSMVSNTNEYSVKDNSKVIVMLCILVLQIMKRVTWSKETRNTISGAIKVLDQWSIYQIGRSATRYGHHCLASEIFGEISSNVGSEASYYWLLGMSEVCKGEQVISGSMNLRFLKSEAIIIDKLDIIDRFSAGCMKIHKGKELLNTSTSSQSLKDYLQVNFQQEYLRCRTELLSALHQMALLSNSFLSSPPEMIAETQAIKSHNDLLRCGSIVTKFRGCVQDFKRIGGLYSSLYELCFDADPDTLCHLQVYQHLCLCLSQWIEMVCLKSFKHGDIFDEEEIVFSPPIFILTGNKVSNCDINIQELVNTGKQIAGLFCRLVSDPECVRPITNTHVECLINVCKILASTPLCFPRFFYQRLQFTNIELSITPQPRSGNEVIHVSCAQCMAIKIEGVVTSYAKQPKWRSISAIKIILRSNLQQANVTNRGLHNEGKDLNSLPHKQCIEKTAVPHNDFFTQQFLIQFAIAGIHQLFVETRVIDKQGVTWKIGTESCLNIKSFDDQ